MARNMEKGVSLAKGPVGIVGNGAHRALPAAARRWWQEAADR